jgi:hypothetical protein
MNDDDEEEPKWEGLAVKPSIGPRFGAAGAWNEAVANTYYARQADKDEVSKRVAEAGREARETVLWREQCAKETAAIAIVSSTATARILPSQPRRLPRRWTPSASATGRRCCARRSVRRRTR